MTKGYINITDKEWDVLS